MNTSIFTLNWRGTPPSTPSLPRHAHSLHCCTLTAMFAAYCKRRFDFGQATYGNVLSFCGFVWASTQGLLVPWLNRSGSLPDYQILRWSTTSLCLGRLVLAAAYAWPWLLVGEALVVVGAATSFTLLSSETSKIVPPAVVGSVVGITAAIDSGCGILVPPLMGQLFDAYGDASGATKCKLCPAGKYTQSPAQTECIECPAGGFCEETGADSSMVFQGCSPGTWSDTIAANSSLACRNCTAGTYSPKTGATNWAECRACRKGGR